MYRISTGCGGKQAEESMIGYLGIKLVVRFDV